MDIRVISTLLMTVVLGAALLPVVAQAWRGQRQAAAARAWPGTTGRVVESGVRESTVRRRIRTRGNTYYEVTRYAPRVVYAYAVDGRQYQAERLRMGDALVSSDTGDARAAAARYPVGQQVTVYYNPADAAAAVLDPRPAAGTQALWLVAAILVVLLGALVWLIWGGLPLSG